MLFQMCYEIIINKKETSTWILLQELTFRWSLTIFVLKWEMILAYKWCLSLYLAIYFIQPWLIVFFFVCVCVCVCVYFSWQVLNIFTWMVYKNIPLYFSLWFIYLFCCIYTVIIDAFMIRISTTIGELNLFLCWTKIFCSKGC